MMARIIRYSGAVTRWIAAGRPVRSFDPALADLIIDIQMRLVPRILKSLDQLLAEKGF